MTTDSLCILLRCAIYVAKRGWTTALEIQDVGSGASPKREELGAARGFDRIVVWRLDRWERSLRALVSTQQELASLNVPLSEALDLSTPSGRALAGMLAVFADDVERDIMRARVKAY